MPEQRAKDDALMKAEEEENAFLAELEALNEEEDPRVRERKKRKLREKHAGHENAPGRGSRRRRKDAPASGSRSATQNTGKKRKAKMEVGTSDSKWIYTKSSQKQEKVHKSATFQA